MNKKFVEFKILLHLNEKYYLGMDHSYFNTYIDSFNGSQHPQFFGFYVFNDMFLYNFFLLILHVFFSNIYYFNNKYVKQILFMLLYTPVGILRYCSKRYYIQTKVE